MSTAVTDSAVPSAPARRDLARNDLSAVIKAYDVSLKQKPGLTDRTSYVIDRTGKITFVHSDLDWSEHVAKTLAAVKALKR